MSKPMPPCKGCTKRIVGEGRDKSCHSHCEEYKRFHELSEQNKEQYHKSLIWDKYYEAQVKKQKRNK